MEILILLGLILLNGVFAMSEIAIVTARKARLGKLASEGNRSAAIALKLGEDPTHFLSAVQIGITSIGLLNGIYGESLLAQPFSLWLQEWGLPAKSSGLIATIIVVVVVTYLSIVVGELVPKRLGQLNAERIACLVARPMHWLATLTRPFVWLLSASTNASLRLLRVNQNGSANVTEEEILEHVRPLVARWWVPDAVEFIDEVPKTSVGKFSKKDLRSRFAEFPGSAVVLYADGGATAVKSRVVLAREPCAGKFLGDIVAEHYTLYAVFAVRSHAYYAVAQEFQPRFEQGRGVKQDKAVRALYLFRDIICNVWVDYLVEQFAFLLVVEYQFRCLSAVEISVWKNKRSLQPVAEFIKRGSAGLYYLAGAEVAVDDVKAVFSENPAYCGYPRA